MSKIKFLTEKYGITCLSNDNLKLFVSEIYNDGSQAGKDKSELRDHFAGLAMKGLLANSNMGDAALHASATEWVKDITETAYEFADCMIAERNKHHKEHYETFGEEV